jgi:hypothetical protein
VRREREGASGEGRDTSRVERAQTGSAFMTQEHHVAAPVPAAWAEERGAFCLQVVRVEASAVGRGAHLTFDHRHGDFPGRPGPRKPR